MKASEFFYALTPDLVLSEVERVLALPAGTAELVPGQLGIRATGYCQALNSFENRVYEIELEEDLAPDLIVPSGLDLFEGLFKGARRPRRLVAKFYRPLRWTKDQILDEHQFLLDLMEAEVPVVPPLKLRDGSTLAEFKTNEGPIWFCLFPKVGGRAPDELGEVGLRQVGRLLGRMHRVGERRPATHRLQWSPRAVIDPALEAIERYGEVPAPTWTRFEAAARELGRLLDANVAKVGHGGYGNQAPQSGLKLSRVHGDCHSGNLLWCNERPFFLDFDDMMMGPRVQDLWLLVPRSLEGLPVLLEGYSEFSDMSQSEVGLIEGLRALRFVHYVGWIAKRWEDPAFPPAFPQFGTDRYWSDELRDLEEQLTRV